MSKEENINRLIGIIERLEINARERDNELRHAKELIETLRSAQQIKQENTHLFGEAAAVAKEVKRRTNEATRDRSRDLIAGINLQLGDWVKILKSRAGQPKEGVVIVKTRDNLIKVEGKIAIGDRDVTKVIRRISDNIALLILVTI